MKTVFGHSIIQDGCGTPVYNCKFDKLDRLVITGADDGIIKIWRKDTMVLQASLHGHMDVIIDIQVSHCNRYLASGSKDGTVIIWDLEKCSIIKKQTSDHSAQVNRLNFIMIPCSKTQVNKNSTMRKDSNVNKIEQQAYFEMYQNSEYQESGARSDETEAQYDQYLVSCSDDGSINVYDCSSFKKSCNDEFYTTNLQDKTKIFKPHSKAIKQFSESTLLMQSLSIEQKEPVAATVEEQNDKVTRRTRKRHFQAATQPGGITNHNTASSSSQSPNCSQDSEINMFKLRPEDFRIGSKNKHIDAFSVNQKGFVVGATNSGEIYLWKMNFSNMRQRKNENQSLWINSFKLHKKAIHYVEFNQSGNILMTGSADGTSCLWDMKCLGDKTQKVRIFGEESKGAEEVINKEQKFKYKNIDISEQKTLIYKFHPKSELFESQIDHIEWSKNGRYAFCAMSVKPCKKPDEEENPNQEQQNQKQAIVQIKVYDTFSGQVIENLDKACRLGKEIKNYACVMKSHPFKQNVLLACFDGGISILYDIQSMSIIQEIIEYGIYSIDQFTMNNAVDVDFSQDGDYIAFSSIYGTLSLYSTQHHKKIQYQCTRVQQFFNYDDRMHDKNLYEECTEQPQLMGYELNPYEQQPGDPIVGKFKNHHEYTDEEFYRQQLFAKEFAVEEEIFYQDQLATGIQRGLFDPDSPEMRNAAAQAQQRQPESGIALVSYNAVEVMNEEMHQDSDDEILQRRRTSVVRANAGNQRRRRLARTDELPEDINDSLRDIDEGEDDSFEDSKSNSNQEESEEDEDNFSLNMQSEYHNGHRVGVNLHSQARNERDYITNEDINRHRSQRRQVVNDDASQSQSQGRNLRSRRPQVQEQSQSQSQSQNMNLRRRRRVVARSSENSLEDDRSDDQSNFGRRGPGFSGRRQQRNRRQPGRNQEILSSENELMDDGESDSLDREQGRRRSGRNNNRSTTRRPAEQQNGGRRSRGRRPVVTEQIRPRTNRRGQDIEDESMLDNLLETDQDKTLDIETVDQILGDEKNIQELDVKLEYLISQNNFKDIKDSDTYSQRGSKSKHGAVIVKEGKLKEIDSNYSDSVFILKDKASVIEKSCAVCYFCKRQIEEDNLVGPFVRQGQAQEILESQDEDQIQSQTGQYFFHDRCLSVNKYVKYDKTKNKWNNIAIAIKNLVDDKSYTCYRCLLPGATSQCVNCDRKFHGHYCNKLYMLATDYEDQNHICIFCRNIENFKSYKQGGELAKEVNIFHASKLTTQRKEIEKSHIFESRPFSSNNFYVPQIGDEVVYFFQGHEKFHQLNNCYFYCGDNEKISSKDLPWMRNNFVKNIPHGQLVCKVLDIGHKFPSIKASNLMEMYGEYSSEISQVAQIITYVYLQVQDPKNQIKFTAQIFKSEANQYIVHKSIYDAKFELYQQACANNTLQGKRFKTTRGSTLFNGHDVQVQDITPVEPDYMGKSHWESIQVIEIENQQRGRRTASSTETDRINFWELIYPEENKIPLSSYLPTAFDEMENERLIDVAQIFIQKKTDICADFLLRVEEMIANDYKSWVPNEMWLNLILDRLTNKYYRSLDQLYFDLESITQCSVIYNGEEDELTVKAQKMVENLKKDMRYHITCTTTKVNRKIIHDVDQPVLGFSNQNIIKDSDSIDQPNFKAPPSKEKKFDTSIGQGGINIKNHLKDNMDFESQETSNKIQIDINGDPNKRRVGRPRKIKRTVDDQGNQLTQLNQDSNNTQNELQDLSNNSRRNSYNANTEGLFNGPKMTIAQRKTRRQLKISGEDAEEDQVILAKVDEQIGQSEEGGPGVNNDADVIVGVKRNHNQASGTVTKPSGIITIDTGPGPEEAAEKQNQNSGKIQIPMGDIRRSTRNKRQKIDM